MALLAKGADLEKYRIDHFLDSGSFGEVYICHDRALDQRKALKLIAVADPNSLKELIEAQVAHKCRHQHSVQVNEANIFNIAGKLYVAIDMEFIEGTSAQRLVIDGKMPISLALEVTQKILFGLANAHNQGVLHKDIKPGNILLSNKGDVKLSDFGLAEFVGNGMIGQAAGYTSHLAPEYFTNNNCTVQTDLFALGMTMFRMVNAMDDWDVTLAKLANLQLLIRNGKLVETIGFKRFVPKAIRRIIRKSTCSDPMKRYRSALEFRQDIDKIAIGIDWHKADQLNWVGKDRKKREHTISVIPDKKIFQLNYMITGRRALDKCQKFLSIQEAINTMEDLVALEIVA